MKNNLKEFIENILSRYIPKAEGFQKTLIEAVDYGILSGGKRLRPALMYETWQLFGGEDENLIAPFMAAIEMIHSFSLIHDDLPALDNDLYRRGKKTVHAVWGAGMATLAGDALLNLAFETALKSFGHGHDDRVIEALKVLASKAGIYGMTGGQSADIELENSDSISDEAIEFINENKTACMIESSLMIGAILAGADTQTVKKLESAGSCLGTAFQIRDDILNLIGTEKELGKPIGSDEKKGKNNYLHLHGLEKSQQKVAELSSKAVGIFDELYSSRGIKDTFLSDIAKEMETRKK